jgi:hypothetical protein
VGGEVLLTFPTHLSYLVGEISLDYYGALNIFYIQLFNLFNFVHVQLWCNLFNTVVCIGLEWMNDLLLPLSTFSSYGEWNGWMD